MSKSSGEFLRLQLLVDKGYHPLAYRMMCLQAHYRSELEFSWEGLQAAFVRLKRMVAAVERQREIDTSQPYDGFGQFTSPDEDFWTEQNIAERSPPTRRFQDDVTQHRLRKAIRLALFDDLNTAVALTVVDDALTKGGSPYLRKWLLEEFEEVLGLNLLKLTRKDLRIRPKAATITETEIEAALKERKAARAAKDFATSDRIRDDLIARGVDIMDGDPLGWDWKLG